ncbi:MAG: lipopolysaccharide transport periplasmic protein LptA [Motiliproteus sp.]|nr:lipopolysaccharide transport periplasmic protein LptA [Motiliproteus sp.]MCW9051002.1 lipopolysaccharide transport periplasmic protein LptA [Motiliproteus sp.]
MNRNNGLFWHCCLSIAALFMLALSPASHALPEDKDQPIELKADSAEMDDKKGISVYIGKVFLKQGSMEIEADKITIYSDDQGVSQMIAVGRPVKFRQRPNPQDPLTKGFALKMDYDVGADFATFTEKAKLIQGGDTFKGDRIEFDLGKDIVSAFSDSNDPDKRVIMVLQPRKKEGSK